MPVVLAGAEAEMYGETFRHDPNGAALRTVWRPPWAEVDRAALVKTLLGVLIRPDVRAALAAVTAPTLIIAGGADLSLPLRFAEEVHDLTLGRSTCSCPGSATAHRSRTHTASPRPC